MAYHFFSDDQFAGPGSKELLRFWDRTSRQLRPRPRITIPQYTFPDSHINGQAEIATINDAQEISTFWNQYYSGDDWTFKCNSNDVKQWMSEGFILIMKEPNDRKKSIVATFVYHVINCGVVCGSFIPKAGLIDGLVVHPRLRGTGLAAYMLIAMDKEVYSRPETSQSISLWFREHSNSLSAVLQTPVAILEYTYIKLCDIPKHNAVATIADSEMVTQILNSVFMNSAKEFTISARNSLDKNIYWFLVNSSLVGIADTHRVSNSGYSIWEVIFASNFVEPYFNNLQTPIEIASLSLPCDKGVIFASNSKTRGNLGIVNTPWRTGKSGYLSLHVYNWMPPTFINGDIFFPYSCI